MWSPTAIGKVRITELVGYISHHALYETMVRPEGLVVHSADVPPCSTVEESPELQPSSPTQNRAQASTSGHVAEGWTHLALTEAKGRPGAGLRV